MRLKSNQGKIVYRKLLRITALRFAIYAVVFALITAFIWQPLYQQIAYVFADIVSPWQYVSEEEWTDLRNQIYSSNSGSETTPSIHDLGFWNFGGLYAVRNLVLYHAFLEASDWVLAGFFVLGALIIAWRVIARAAYYIDELSGAINGLFADKTAPLELPKDLEATRVELLQIQNRALADERTAKAAETRKNELVAYLAHDIRTPLTSVIGYLAILKDSPNLPLAERNHCTRVAYDKAEQLDGLIEEFFEITRYNLQAIPIERERIDLSFFCHQVAEEFIPLAQERALNLSVHAPADKALFVDPNKFARALSNVLRNAISYARPETTVEINAYDQERSTVIEVIDDGKEISPEHLSAIFEKFFREDASRSSTKGSAGLGLAIAKEIIEAHGGTIQAESSQGKTLFRITLPR